jgi:hypothetical protein
LENGQPFFYGIDRPYRLETFVIATLPVVPLQFGDERNNAHIQSKKCCGFPSVFFQGQNEFMLQQCVLVGYKFHWLVPASSFFKKPAYAGGFLRKPIQGGFVQAFVLQRVAGKYVNFPFWRFV